MADITKCSGQDCPIKKKCYRYTAIDGYWQSYFFASPINRDTGECDKFWNNEVQDNKRL